MIILATLAAGTLVSCGGGGKHEKPAAEPDNQPDWNGYYKVSPKELQDNFIELIGDQWMLITAGNSGSFNTMTASWGAMGNMWSRPAAFIFVRESRYTYQFLENSGSYTLSFYDEGYRRAMEIIGSRSGRDGDKVAEAGLTPMEMPAGNMAFAEARMIIECDKMFAQPIDPANLAGDYKPAITGEAYTAETTKHVMFIGDIKSVWVKHLPVK